MAKPKPPPPPRPQWRAGDVVVLRQGQDYVEGEIIATLVDGRYKVHWLTGSNYQDRVTTVTAEDIRRKTLGRGSASAAAPQCLVGGSHIKCLWVKLSPNPLAYRSVFRMLGISDHRQQLPIPLDTPAVLRRTVPLASQADRDPQLLLRA